MNVPRVSVLMPVRNGEKHLEEAVRSILAQTFSDFELVAVDDGSTDGTGEILAQFAETDSRVRVHCIGPSGLVAALNAGIAIARGAYIARMDADDISLPHRLERQVEELDSRDSLGVLGTQVRYVDAVGKPIGTWSLPVGCDLARWTLFFGTPLAHPSVMLRALLFERHTYSQSEPHAEDYDLWLRLSAETQLDNLPEILFERRVHGESVSDVHERMQLASALRVQRRAIAAALGRAPEEGSIEAMRNPRSIRQVLSAVILIWRLYLKTGGTARVRRDAVRRSIAAVRSGRRSL